MSWPALDFERKRVELGRHSLRSSFYCVEYIRAPLSSRGTQRQQKGKLLGHRLAATLRTNTHFSEPRIAVFASKH